VILSALLGTLTACQVARDFFPFSEPQRTPSPHMRQPVIERIRARVQPDLVQHLETHETGVLHTMAVAGRSPAQYKPGLLVHTLSDPWPNLATLERHSLLAAEMAEGGLESIPALVDVLEAGLNRTAVSFSHTPFPSSMAGDELLDFFTDVLQEAYEDREKALQNLTLEERVFLHTHALSIAQQFAPHIPELNAAREIKDKDIRFARLLAERVDYANLIVAAQRLTSLGNETFLRRLSAAFSNQRPLSGTVSGVTGDVLFVRQTSYGLIVIGGSGPNIYDLDATFALVIDLGGDDVYRGAIGASWDLELGHSVVIDLEGNDLYESSPLGLATGRLGVGVVVDLAGHDRYRLAPGAGGTGFAGLGILYDREGDDRYIGSRFSQGAAAGGLGLLVDRSGDDEYSADAYGIGFGTWLGLGAVIDVEGNDTYHCGGRYPSTYNKVDHPGARPGDPGFEYDCFGLGSGVGSRVMGPANLQEAYNLAGGWGILLDVAGDDLYRSDNFSQGLGYFFGMGIKLDLDGHDVHVAARYGHGSSAHFGVGVFLDRHGDDRYESSGPFYNGGAAWDSSVALMVDAGSGNDMYLLALSTGLGIADHGAWAACVDEGGTDRYLVGDGLGWGLNTSVAAFFDLAGQDTYTDLPTTGTQGRGNARILQQGDRGLFIDK
jgi:hypothetical protein